MCMTSDFAVVWLMRFMTLIIGLYQKNYVKTDLATTEPINLTVYIYIYIYIYAFMLFCRLKLQMLCCSDQIRPDHIYILLLVSY